MIRLLILAFAIFLLASCVPSVNSKNYAEQISEDYFRSTYTYGETKTEKVVVPIQAGKAITFERAFSTKGRDSSFDSG